LNITLVLPVGPPAFAILLLDFNKCLSRTHLKNSWIYGITESDGVYG
jgi:hypothetical protein